MAHPHRILVVGVGSIGERHVRCFGLTGRARVSLCEINPELRARVASRYDVQGACASLGEALEDPPDAAVICTPANLHVSMALELGRAGVHLLIEKPLSTDEQGLGDLAQVASLGNLTVAVAYCWRAHPCLQELKAALDEGRFGAPRHLIAMSGQHFPTYRPAYRNIYYASRSTGGGAIQDALTHVLNAGEWMVGPIDRLAVDAAHQVLEGVEVEDTVNLIARQGPVLASYSQNQYQAPGEFTLTIVCERGTCRFEQQHLRWRWMQDPDSGWHDHPLEAFERDTMYVRQANAFLDALEGRGAPLCSLPEGVQTLRVNLAALKAADTGTWQEVGRGA